MTSDQEINNRLSSEIKFTRAISYRDEEIVFTKGEEDEDQNRFGRRLSSEAVSCFMEKQEENE